MKTKAKRRSPRGAKEFAPANALEGMGSRKLRRDDCAIIEGAFWRETGEALALTSERWSELGAAIWFARYYTRQKAEGKVVRGARNLLKDIETAAQKLRTAMLAIKPDGPGEQSTEAKRVWDALGCEVESPKATAFDVSSNAAISALPETLRELLARIRAASVYLSPETKLGAPSKFPSHESLISSLAVAYREATGRKAAAGYAPDKKAHTGPFHRFAKYVVENLKGVPPISEKALGSLIDRKVCKAQ